METYATVAAPTTRQHDIWLSGAFSHTVADQKGANNFEEESHYSREAHLKPIK
jgi:hypothetical protein